MILVKILGSTGKISVHLLKISAHKFSKSAAAKLAIEKSGGEAITIIVIMYKFV